MSTLSASGGGNRRGTPRPVFLSPSQMDSASDTNQIEALLSRHSFPDDLEKSLNVAKKEDHEKRVKALTKQLEYIEQTNWQFDSTEKLTGQ